MMEILKYVLGVFMIGVGVLHFVSPRGFEKIVPPWLPNAKLLVYISGVFEILGGLGLMIPFSQRFAAWGLIALFLAVFPANIHMAVNNVQISKKKPIPAWVAWARLPLQFVLIAWAYAYT